MILPRICIKSYSYKIQMHKWIESLMSCSKKIIKLINMESSFLVDIITLINLNIDIHFFFIKFLTSVL